jgi:septal ring factor EnvC (AmiA/AmiB activator)
MEDDKNNPKYVKLLAEYSKVRSLFQNHHFFIAPFLAKLHTQKRFLKFLSHHYFLKQLRASAKVLKNAVIEERNKVSVLQESIRMKDQNLRRIETEIDSINFRNKQLEHRVATLQEDLQASQKSSKSGANSKVNKIRVDNQVAGSIEIDSLIAEELQKKIIENAQLASTVSTNIIRNITFSILLFSFHFSFPIDFR